MRPCISTDEQAVTKQVACCICPINAVNLMNMQIRT